jgi:F1F0 ATPase subunit 2
MSTSPLTVTALMLAAFAAGAGLGWLFYAGLYRTVRELHRTRRPALLLGGSLLLRLLLLLAGFWGLLLAGARWTGDGWLGLVPGLLGVIAMRTLLLHRYGRPGASRPGDASERHPQ